MFDAWASVPIPVVSEEEWLERVRSELGETTPAEYEIVDVGLRSRKLARNVIDRIVRDRQEAK